MVPSEGAALAAVVAVRAKPAVSADAATTARERRRAVRPRLGMVESTVLRETTVLPF
ncbi:hypothetical protein GCM10017602_24480 [Herbiconiux flava]|nr:hypothetical protein GCM10017602_24480 [Herbiconiux flava]